MSKRVVITGGTKGIGWAIANAFAAEGYDIALCARTKIDLDHRETALLAVYPDIDVLTKVVDMSKKDEVKQFGEYISKNWGYTDILVNNAGFFVPGEISNEPDGNLESQMETNLYSAYHLTRGLLPQMIERKSGQIINICSIASKIAYPNGGSYSISKFAMLGFTKVLREEMKEKGIRVTAILPGATWSDSWKDVDLPEDRLMQARDIAKTVVNTALLSETAVVEEVIIRPQLGDL